MSGSWQDYVDIHLLGSGRMSQAAILGQKGGIWASSAGLSLSSEEQTALINAYTEPDRARSTGLHIGGRKYFALSFRGQTIQLKAQADGAVLVKTRTAILVAVCNAPIELAECSPVVERLADYLISVNY